MRPREGFGVFQSDNWWGWACLILAGLVVIILLLGAVFGASLWDAILLRDKEFDPLIEVEGDTVNVAPPNVNVSCPAPIINLSCPCEEPLEEHCIRWLYAVPFVCGLSEYVVNETTRVIVAEHSFSMTVLNPQYVNVTFDKRISMTFPPGLQIPGDVFLSFPSDTLSPYEALEMACQEIRVLLNPVKREVGPLIKGYASVTTPVELVVWGIHGTARKSQLGPTIPYKRNANTRQEFGLVSTDAITFDKELAVGVCVETSLKPPPVLI
jgi:hypothetical protein